MTGDGLVAEGQGEVEEYEEVIVDVMQDGTLLVHGENWEVPLQPSEARQLADALDVAADEIEASMTLVLG